MFLLWSNSEAMMSLTRSSNERDGKCMGFWWRKTRKRRVECEGLRKMRTAHIMSMVESGVINETKYQSGK